MDLLKAIFEPFDELRGEIALYLKGYKGGVQFVTVDEAKAYEGEKDWWFHLATHDKSLVTEYGRGSIKSAQQFTTLWCDLDLDSKDDGYPAMDEVEKLISDLNNDGAGPSAIIHSGAGLHLYWFLDKPEESKTYPSACKSWITYLSKRLDTVCGRAVKLDQVGDMARVLRLPGTIHSKHGRLVRTLTLDAEKRYDLASLLKLTTYFDSKERGTGKSAVQNKLLQAMGTVKSSVPSYTANMIYSCAQVKNFFQTGGDVSEPEWYSMAGLLPYTEDGLNYFLNLSVIAGEAVALKKVDQWKEASEGPATCQRMFDNNPSLCGQCPHFNKITTPLQLGYSKPVAMDTSGKQVGAPNKSFSIEQEQYIEQYVPPQPFLFDTKGSICAAVEDSTGANRVKVICHNRVIPYKRIWDEDEKQEVIYFNIETPNDGWREVDIPLAALQGSCQGLNKLMGSGALVVNQHSTLMASYLIGCVKYMQELKKVNQSYSRIGWRGPTDQSDSRDNDDKFVLGSLSFYKTGEVKKESLIPDLQSSLKDIGMKGDVDQWKQAISIFAKPGFEKHLICLMGAFAVPLFRSVDYHGMMVNLLSRDSGSFKSFTLRALTSVYGKPSEKHILSRDSEKSVYAKIATRCDLPITYDEITNIDKDQLSDLTYAVTQGRRGDRLNQDSSLKVNESIWRTIMFCSSNASLDDMMSGSNLAERMRLLELPIDISKMQGTSDSEARQTMSLLDNNYGQAGVLWIKYIIDNKDALFDECDRTISQLTNITKSRSDKRFWISFLAFVLVSAKHTRLMGLHSFDINSIAETCKEILNASSSKIDSDHIPLPMYAQQFLTSSLDSTLTIYYNSVTARNGEIKRSPIARIAVKIENRTIGQGKRSQIAYISRSSMKKYLSEMRVTFDDFIQEMRNVNVLIREDMVKRVTNPETSETFGLRAFSIDLDKLDSLYMTEGEVIEKNSTIV